MEDYTGEELEMIFVALNNDSRRLIRDANRYATVSDAEYSPRRTLKCNTRADKLKALALKVEKLVDEKIV